MYNVMIVQGLYIYYFRTRVVQDELDNVLDLGKGQMVLWPLAGVPVYSHCWSVCQVALFDVLKPLDSNVVEKQEGTLTHPLAMVVKLTIRCLPFFRSGAVVTMQCGRLIAVSHNLTNHKQVQLVMAHLRKACSEGQVMLDREEH